MKTLHLVVAVACIGLSSTVARASGSQEFNDLLYFEGAWDCACQAFDPITNTNKDVTSLYTVNSQLGGTWLQAVVFEASGDVSKQISSRSIGYDAAWKRYVAYEVGAQGEWSFVSAPTAWGSKTVWEGHVHNFQGQLNLPLQETVRRVSQDAFNVLSQVKSAAGQWRTLYDGSCHRQVHSLR